MNKTIDVTFKNVEDFRRRITLLWQNQKENEIYNFIFLDDEAEKEFNNLVSCFHLQE